MARKTEAVIRLSACKHNLNRVRRSCQNSKILAMVKSNGYGHGLIQVAQAFVQSGADALGVAVTNEAVELRAAGMKAPIFVMEGFFDREEIEAIVEYGCIAVVHHVFQIEMLEKHALKKRLPIWVKVDTGMNRLGFEPHHLAECLQRLQKINGVDVLGVMTHFANADLGTDGLTSQQIILFEMLTRGMQLERSLANSAGVLGWPCAHADWVRPGLMLYGVSPLINTTAHQFELMPVMTLRSQIISIKPVSHGAGVSYGTVWRAPQDTTIGIVAIGYGDGYPGHAPSGTPILVNGKKVPLVGRVCMDMLAVDLGPNPTTQIGDVVTLWGEGLPIEEVARCANTTPYDLLCGVTRRVHFRYLEESHHGMERTEAQPNGSEMATLLSKAG